MTCGVVAARDLRGRRLPLDADPVEGVVARGSALGFCLLVDGEAVGELGAVVGQNGVDRERKAIEKAIEESSGGGGPAIGEDFEIDKAGGAVDRNPSLRWGRL